MFLMWSSSLLLLLLLIVRLGSATLDHIKEEVAALPHGGFGPYCLGSIGSLALEGTFRNPPPGAEKISVKRRSEIVIASVPQSGAVWLASSLEHSGRYKFAHTTHYPFIKKDAQPTLDDRRDIVLLVRNPFDAYKSYNDNLVALNRMHHRAASVWKPMTLDEFVKRWRTHNDYWALEKNAVVLRYEHLLADPIQTLGRSFSLIVEMAIAARARTEAETPPPLETTTTTTDGACGKALDGIAPADVEQLVRDYQLGDFGYSLAKRRRPSGGNKAP